MTPEQKYYEYHPGSGQWWLKEVPVADPAFQKRLIEFAGLNPHGQPILRLSWAGTLLHDYTVKPQLKYKITYNWIRGYWYIKKDGTTGYTYSMNKAVDAKIPHEFHPKIEQIPLGRLRWIVEEWESPESLRKKGRFQKLTDAEGNRILRELPNEGVYNHYFWIQTAARKYRAPDREVLTAVEAMWKYDITTTMAQKQLDAQEAEQNNLLVGAEEARGIWKTLDQGVK